MRLWRSGRRLRGLEEHPIIRYIGFGTQGTVETAWPSLSGLELRECHFDTSFTSMRIFCRTNPADPVPARHWRDLHPQGVCLWGGSESVLQICWYPGFRPFFHRLNRQHYSAACVCSSGFAHGFVELEPVASLTVWFEWGLKAEIIDGSRNHCHSA